MLRNLVRTVSVVVVAGGALIAVAAVSSSARAGTGDPTLRTDHPVYPGEGAFQTIENCTDFATDGKESPQDKAIALYLWLLQHQYHLASPQEWCVPGRAPDTAQPGDYEMIPFDANRARFSYGYGLCGTVHAWNEPYWKALGMRVRRRAFPGHVNSEVFHDGAWRAYDTDMAGLLFRRDGTVAGYDDIVRDPALIDSVKPPLPHYPFAWPGDFQGMKQGWLEVAKAPQKWFALYDSGYAAHPGIVRLRAGESFVRWFDRDRFGGPSKRRFWHHLPGGPRRDWTYMNTDVPFHDKAKSNARNDASYCNAEFVYEPPLDSDRFREGTLAVTDNVAAQAASPKLRSTDGRPASVVFRHFSPYVICGDPQDDANPMTGPATGGLVVSGRLRGNVAVAVSADEGQSWHDVAFPQDAVGEFRFDLTDHVKGRYGWRIRFSWSGQDGLDRLKFDTVCQMSQAIYPRLKSDGSHVTYRSASRDVIAVLPDFGVPDERTDAFEVRALRSANVGYAPRTGKSRVAYTAKGNKPGQVVFRVESPSELLAVHAAIRYPVRVPPPETVDYRLAVSTDDGKTWKEFARSDVPRDNEFSSGWLSGRTEIAGTGVRTALVRTTFHADGYAAGLIDAQFYGVCRTPPPQETTVEYGWRDEKGTSRTFSTVLPAGTTAKTFDVPTGPEIRDEFVRITAAR